MFLSNLPTVKYCNFFLFYLGGAGGELLKYLVLKYLVHKNCVFRKRVFLSFLMRAGSWELGAGSWCHGSGTSSKINYSGSLATECLVFSLNPFLKKLNSLYHLYSFSSDKPSSSKGSTAPNNCTCVSSARSQINLSTLVL